MWSFILARPSLVCLCLFVYLNKQTCELGKVIFAAFSPVVPVILWPEPAVIISCSLPSKMFTAFESVYTYDTLATWCEQPAHGKGPWCWERLEAEGEGNRGWNWLDGTTGSMDMNFGKLWEMVRDREAWRTAVHGGHKELDVTWNWKTTTTHTHTHTHSYTQWGRAS